MLPTPECKYGYPAIQLEKILGDRMPDFFRWMRGQTFALCDGREYDYGAREYKPTGCGPHGAVYYSSDVRQFLAGGHPLD